MACTSSSKLLYCKCVKKAPETKPTNEKIRDRCQPLILSDETLKRTTGLFLDEVKKGLSRRTHDEANVKCYVTYVQELPKGDEKGKFLALDFADQNLRLLLCEITEHGLDVKAKTYKIPEHTLFSTGEKLFDKIVDALAKFMKEEQLTREKRFLALTFGFPLLQQSLERAFLVKWTKGFKCSNVVGNDVVELLKDAIERKGDIDVEVCAILSDTTGTLISCAYDHPTCKIAAIVCNGTNACYVEKIKNVQLFDDTNSELNTVVINTEWGGFGDDGYLDFLRTEQDFDVDDSTFHHGQQVFEKMVAGFYMGELVRLTMVQLTKDGLLFNGKGTVKLYTSETFPAEYIYRIEEDPPDKYDNCREVLTKIGFDNVTDNDCINVRYICECISRRSAVLVAAALAALVNKINQPFVTIGIDGSVYNEHPHYHHILTTTIMKLLKRGVQCEIVSARDGAGRGAALLAAVVSKKFCASV